MYRNSLLETQSARALQITGSFHIRHEQGVIEKEMCVCVFHVDLARCRYKYVETNFEHQPCNDSFDGATHPKKKKNRVAPIGLQLVKHPKLEANSSKQHRTKSKLG